MVFGQARRSWYRSDDGDGRGVGLRVGLGVGLGVAVGAGVGVTLGIGAGVAVASATTLGEAAGASVAGDGEITAAGADTAEPVGPMLKAPPRASTKATDALNAMTSTTKDPSIAGDIARPGRTTGVGVSVMTAAPRR